MVAPSKSVSRVARAAPARAARGRCNRTATSRRADACGALRTPPRALEDRERAGRRSDDFSQRGSERRSGSERGRRPTRSAVEKSEAASRSRAASSTSLSTVAFDASRTSVRSGLARGHCVTRVDDVRNSRRSSNPPGRHSRLAAPAKRLGRQWRQSSCRPRTADRRACRVAAQRRP